MSLSDLQETVRNLATKAVEEDRNGHVETAIFYYMVT